MTLPIRYRFALTISLALTMLLAAYAASLLYVARERLLSELDRRLEIEAFVAADLIRLGAADAASRLRFRDVIEAEEVNALGEMLELEVRQGPARVYLRAPADPDSLLARTAFDPDAPYVDSQYLDGHSVRLLQLKFQHVNASWFVRVAADERESLKSLAGFRATVLVGAAIVLPVTVLLSYWLAGQALRPLSRIAVEASAISAASLDHRVAVPQTGDEIALLASGFNQLLDRLQVAFSELRQFTADASHELRTPLTVIQSSGELALTRQQTPQEYRDTISHMLEEVDRLRQLIDALLMLARGEVDTTVAPATEAAPRDLAESVCAQLRPLAEERAQTLTVHSGTMLPTLIDANLASLAVMNIVHNAVKFAPDGGRIDVYVDCSDSAVTFVVDDTGPGIPAAERKKVFDRFYRSNPSRRLTGRGFGLGLAIARAAIAKLGGTIVAGQSSSGGARFSILIPRKSARIL